MDLKDTLRAWNTPEFAAVFSRELSATGTLPLQNHLRYGGVALTDKLSIMVLKSWDDAAALHVKTGIFFSSIIAGCNCADDPTPIDEQPEYAELEVVIDKQSGAARVL